MSPTDHITSMTETINIGGIDYPDELVRALLDRRLVVFAGAGVSMPCPSHLPNFNQLVGEIECRTGRAKHGVETHDQYLGRSEIEHGVLIHEVVAKILKRKPPRHNSIHTDLLRSFGSPDKVRLITTNFDRLFESSAKTLGWDVSSYTAPNLPQSSEFQGIVHLHGSLDDPDGMVLTDSDLGRAYLSQGWANRFLREVFLQNTVLFVGYSHSDVLPRYLVSAIKDVGSSDLFMLSPSKQSGTSTKIGIVPVIYEQETESDHSALVRSIGRLGDHFSQDLVGWMGSISTALESEPNAMGMHEETVRLAFRGERTRQELLRKIPSVAWVQWLYDAGYLDSLFDHAAPADQDHASWRVARLCLPSDSDYLFRIIATRDGHLSNQFANAIAWTLDNEPGAPLGKWLSILLQQPVDGVDQFAMTSLAEACRIRQDVDSCLRLLDFLVKPRFDAARYREPGSYDCVQLTDDIICRSGGSYATSRCWSILGSIGGHEWQMLRISVRSFEDRHAILEAWNLATDLCDLWSAVADPFVPLDDREEPEGFTLVFDIARCALHRLAELGDSGLPTTLTGLSSSQVPILRRLAIDTYYRFKDVSAEDLATWSMTHISVSDTEVRSELARLLESCFAELKPEIQERVAAWLMQGETARGLPEDSLAAQQARWLRRLHEVDPESRAVADRIGELEQRNPEALTNEYPEPPVQSPQAGFIEYPEPFSVEQLLSEPAEEWVDRMNQWEPPTDRGWSFDARQGIWDNVRAASAKRFDWSLDLAEALMTRGDTGSDIWIGLVKAWADPNDAISDWHSVLPAVQPLTERRNLAIDVANVVLKSASTLNDADALDRASEIATALIERQPDECVIVGGDYEIQIMNSVPGLIAQFWMRVADRIAKNDISSTGVVIRTRESLRGFIESDREWAHVSVAAIAAEIHVLYRFDQPWTVCYILPMLRVGHPGFKAAWAGYLSCLVRTRWVPDEVLDVVEGAIKHRAGIRTMNGMTVIGLLAFLRCFRIRGQRDGLIQLMFNSAESEEQRRSDVLSFNSFVELWLRRAVPELRSKIWDEWLRSYVEDRSVGLPWGLVPGEAWSMTRWVEHLVGVAPDAVDVLTSLPVETNSKQRHLMFQFHDVDVSEHPQEYAKLLIYADKHGFEAGAWFRMDDHINKLIDHDAVPGETKHQLQDIKLKYGLE